MHTTTKHNVSGIRSLKRNWSNDYMVELPVDSPAKEIERGRKKIAECDRYRDTTALRLCEPERSGRGEWI